MMCTMVGFQGLLDTVSAIRVVIPRVFAVRTVKNEYFPVKKKSTNSGTTRFTDTETGFLLSVKMETGSDANLMDHVQKSPQKIGV